MSFRILAFSDLHLNNEDDFDVSPLAREIDSRPESESIDAMLSLGDVVDNIPRDREEGHSVREEDIELGRHFFSGLSTIFDDYEVPTYAVPGNHDHDIFDAIIGDEQGSYNGIFDARTGHTLPIDDRNYGIVGADISDFDIGPEVNPEKYGIEDNGRFVDKMLELATVGGSIEQGAESLGINAGDYSEFYTDAETFMRDFAKLERTFEQVYSEARGEDTVFMSHIAPFNTELDEKTIGRSTDEHQGSVVTRAAIEYFRPRLALNGHHDYHAIDYFPDESSYDSDMYAIGLDEATPTEIVLDGGSVGIREQ